MPFLPSLLCSFNEKCPYDPCLDLKHRVTIPKGTIELKGTIIHFFFKWRFFFKALATKHALFKFVWIINKGSQKKGNKEKLRVVAVTHGDDSNFFLVTRRKVTRKS